MGAMKQIKALARRFKAPSKATVVEVSGLVAIAAGAAMIWLPVGLIVGGFAAVFVAQGLEVQNDDAAG